MTTLKLKQLSEGSKHQQFKVKRDTNRTSRSQVTELLKGLVYGNFKRNLQLQATEKPTVTAVLKNLLTGKAASNLNINVGMRNDYRLQQCEGSYFKQTFPDIDYAFFGYDILKGFPLVKGHDPGFTIPIFKTDYNQARQTSDCRYKIPNGVVVVPDVSCVTSFSSTTIQNKYELSKALDVSASANAGGYGASFSASAGYKESSSELESGEVVKILSTAKCNSYFSKLLEDNLPRFTESFITWVNRLNNSKSNATYIDFFNRYGTHYLTYTSFGARFTYEHTMKSSDFQSKQNKGVNIGVQASYSAMNSAGAGFNMDSSQKEEASQFSKSVTTETISVGAPPPANGDTMTWASTVKESPVPMGFKLRSIINLFTDEYMKSLRVDHKHIAYKLTQMRSEYCKDLKRLGKLDSCDPLKPGLMLEDTQFFSHYKSITSPSFSNCMDLCEKEINCLAASFCTSCKHRGNACYMFNISNGYKRYAVDRTVGKTRYDAIIFTYKIPFPKLLHFRKTAVVGISRMSSHDSRFVQTADECFGFCIDDALCCAFTFCTSRLRISKCQIYSEKGISGLTTDKESTTFFMPRVNHNRFGTKIKHHPISPKL